MAELSFRHVYKVYDNGVEALKDFSLEVRDGEFIVLVGPSGCGKSTVLRMIAGLESVTDGEILMGGELINNLKPKDRHVAMVSQRYALLPHYTVYKNIALGLSARKAPKDEIKSKVTDAAEFLGLGGYLKRKPNTLSGGQKQRVALGRAMVTQPHVYIFDEPLTSLDAKLRTEMRGEIIKLYDRVKTTFIYVTHDQIEAMTMATRIVVIDGGVIQAVGTPQEIYSKPANKFVAGFIGTPQMNFFDAELLKSSHIPIFALPAEVGIRAEDIYYFGKTEQYRDKYIELAVTAKLIEDLGGEAFVYCEFGGGKLVFKTRHYCSFARGDKINVYLDAEKLHFFDKATGKNLIC